MDIKPWLRCPDYGACGDGHIWRLTRPQKGTGRLRDLPYRMAEFSTRYGYFRTPVFVGGRKKSVFVHHIVLESFDQLRPEGLVGAHNNGIPTDNRPCNLRWATQAENAADMVGHGTLRTGVQTPLAKLTAQKVRHIRAVCGAGSFPRKSKEFGAVVRSLATDMGVHVDSIRSVLRGRTWFHVKD